MSAPLRASLPVVVLKVHHGSLGIARSLGRLGVEMHGVTAVAGAPAARSRYWAKCHDWDVDGAPPERTVQFLLALGRSLGRGALLIPTTDRTTELVAENEARLRERFLFPDLPATTVSALVSKRSMHRLVAELGIPTARSAFPSSRAELRAFMDRAEFLIMLKAISGVRKRSAGPPVVIARNASELLRKYDELEDPAAPNLMLQEYIPGGEDSVWMFNGYFDPASECRFGITGRKLRQNPVYTGSTSLGICLPNAEVDRTTRAFMKAIGYRGILDIGYRYDARDGRYKVLDVNPRIGSSFRLFVDENGLDVARALYLDLTGQPVPQAGRSEGRRWLVEDQDIESSVRYARDGKLGLRAWLGSFRGVQEGAWFARDDLKPFFSAAGALGASLVRKALARRPARASLARRAA